MIVQIYRSSLVSYFSFQYLAYLKKKCGYAFSFQAILLLSVSNKVDTMTPPLQPFLMPFASTEDPTLLFPTSAKVVIMHISVANILAGTSITCPRP